MTTSKKRMKTRLLTIRRLAKESSKERSARSERYGFKWLLVLNTLDSQFVVLVKSDGSRKT